MISRDLSGIIIPTVTAMKETGEIDEPGLRQVIRYQVAQGADALIPTASNGEFAHLSKEERRQVWEIFFDEIKGKIPIAPCTTATTTRDAIELTKYAESLGASAVLLAPPYYYSISEEELFAHYKRVGESVTIPIIVYNEPSLYKVDLLPVFLGKLSQINNIRYVKESSRDSRRVHEIIRLTKGRITVFAGACDLAFEALALGAKGWITGFLNFYIEAPKELYKRIMNRDFEGAREIYYEKILPLAAFVNASNKGVQVMKTALEMLGVQAGPARPPLLPLSEQEKQTLGVLLKNLGLLK